METYTEYPDNMISDYHLASWEQDIIDSLKAEDYLPFTVYDMVQCGYPLPNHGEMIPRFGGYTDDNGKVHQPDGMWCKVEDVVAYLNTLPKLKND